MTNRMIGALLAAMLGSPVLPATSSAQGNPTPLMAYFSAMCPNARWSGERVPKTDDEWTSLIAAATEWQPAAGLPPNACVLQAVALFALWTEKNYPDRSEADRRYELVIRQSLGNCPNRWGICAK